MIKWTNQCDTFLEYHESKGHPTILILTKNEIDIAVRSSEVGATLAPRNKGS